METEQQNPIRIVVAVIAGTLLIFLAWHSNKTPTQNTQTVANKTEATELNGLTVIPVAEGTSTARKIYYNNIASEVGRGAPTSTVTSQVAHDLLLAYGASQEASKNGTVSPEQADAVAKKILSNIKLPQGRQYSISDIKVSTDNSTTALKNYETTTTNIILNSRKTKSDNEYVLIIDIIKNNTPEKLDRLTPIITNYDTLISNLLAVKTPSSVAELHLRLIQSYSNMQNLTTMMQGLKSDPVAAIASVTEYQKEIASQMKLQEEFNNLLSH